MPAVEPVQKGPSDRQLLREAKAGSAQAFNALVDRYYDDILHYLLARTDSPEESYDLAQETFLDAFRSLRTIPDDRSLKAWLVVTARNNLLHRQRQRRARRLVSLDWILEHRQRVPPEMTTGDPTIRMVEWDTLQGVLAELSLNLRITVDLMNEGYSPREIAERLDISYESARQRVSRATRYVRDRYEDLGLWTGGTE